MFSMGNNPPECIDIIRLFPHKVKSNYHTVRLLAVCQFN